MGTKGPPRPSQQRPQRNVSIKPHPRNSPNRGATLLFQQHQPATPRFRPCKRSFVSKERAVARCCGATVASASVTEQQTVGGAESNPSTSHYPSMPNHSVICRVLPSDRCCRQRRRVFPNNKTVQAEPSTHLEVIDTTAILTPPSPNTGFSSRKVSRGLHSGLLRHSADVRCHHPRSKHGSADGLSFGDGHEERAAERRSRDTMINILTWDWRPHSFFTPPSAGQGERLIERLLHWQKKLARRLRHGYLCRQSNDTWCRQLLYNAHEHVWSLGCPFITTKIFRTPGFISLCRKNKHSSSSVMA